jgi:hypothetical protein
MRRPLNHKTHAARKPKTSHLPIKKAFAFAVACCSWSYVIPVFALRRALSPLPGFVFFVILREFESSWT